MRRWEISLTLDADGGLPLFLQLSAAIAADIRCGRLRPGDPLPGTRALATALGMNRNTIVAGYGELAAEGLVETRAGGGTFVARPLPLSVGPLRKMSAAVAAATPNYALPPPLPLPPPRAAAPVPDRLTLSCGQPDLRLLPKRLLARAFWRALGPGRRGLLAHTDPRGHALLRSELAGMLSRTRGLPVTPDNVLVTHGIEQGLDLVARTLIAPGDAVAIEAWGYPPAWSVLKLAGARLLPVPVDAHGLDIDALETLLGRERLRAVLVTAHHQFPTTVTLAPERRVRLAALALEHRFAIIEDDDDHELHYASRPPLPLAAGPGRANVVYVGSLSDLLAPGLCIGFLFAPSPVFERLVNLHTTCDAQRDAVVECTIAELYADGEMLRHVRRTRRSYEARRHALAAALDRHLGGALEFRLPDGGMGLWARAAADIDVAAWAHAAAREGVTFGDARRYDYFGRDTQHLRLGFSYHDEAELEEAVRRMTRALAGLRGTRAPQRAAAGRARPAIADTTATAAA